MPEKFIDANALTETLAMVAKKLAKSDAQQALMGRVFYILEHRPEGVVRCKDCIYYEIGKDYEPYCNHVTHGIPYPKDDDFCSYGERKPHD